MLNPLGAGGSTILGVNTDGAEMSKDLEQDRCEPTENKFNEKSLLEGTDCDSVNDRRQTQRASCVELPIASSKMMTSQHVSKFSYTGHNEEQSKHHELSNKSPSPGPEIQNGGHRCNHMKKETNSTGDGAANRDTTQFKAGGNVVEENGWTPLHRASQSGNLHDVKDLLSNGEDVNRKDDNGSTAYHIAIHSGHLEVVKYLKTKGAQDIRVKGMTPLYIAAQSGHLDIVNFLISQGAEVNEENDSGQVPLHGAASRSHLKVIKFLVGYRADVNKETTSGWTPFHAAVSNGDLEVVKYLTANGAHKTGFDRMTPLYIAARAGHLDVVKFLISQGVDANEVNSSGYAPIHGACIKGHMEVMQYLTRHTKDVSNAEAADELCYTAESISQPDVVEYIYTESTGNEEKTPLYAAVECGRLDLAEYYIKKGAPVNGTNSNGEVPLHAAARNGNLDITKYLIRLGANLEKGDDEGTTPFLAAIHHGHLEVVKYLKTKGAQDTRIHGMTPLYIAAQSGHLDIVKFLVSQGADVNEENDSGQVPLHAAADKGHLEVLQFLVEHGANVKTETLTGSTPFFRAVSNGQLEAVKYLLSIGARMTRCHGITPLYIAAQNGHSEVVKFLIEEGTNVNDENISGSSPLHAASYTGNLEIVKYLVANKANVDGKDKNDWTPLHAAAQEGHTDVAIYLISDGANIHSKDVEGLTPRLLPSDPVYPHLLEYLNSQRALKIRSYQDHGDSIQSFETGCDVVTDDKDQLSGSGVKGQLSTALHHDDISRYSQDMSSNADHVEKGNGYTSHISPEQETDTIITNYKTPTGTKERIKGDRSPFAHARSKSPVNKSHRSLPLEAENSSNEQLDTKHISTALQTGPFKWKHNQVKASFLHLTKKTAHQEVTRSGRGIRREDYREMKVPSLMKFRGNTAQPLVDEQTENTSASQIRIEVLQISNEECAPTIDSISTGSSRDAKNKRRTTGSLFSPTLILLQTLIKVVFVIAIFQAGRPVLVAGIPRTEKVTLQAGKSGVVSFYIPRPSDNTSQITAYFTLRFESKLRPFCINGKSDIGGFKSPSQIPRFEIIMIESSTYLSINLNIDSVDTQDQDMYILTVIFHGLEKVLGETVRKEVLVNIPPGPAKCFITLSESSNCPYEVHCQTTTGDVETSLTCYQNKQKIPAKGEIEGNSLITRGIFLLPDNNYFCCCSHDVNFIVSEEMCNDFEWPPGRKSISPPIANDSTPTPSVANTADAIRNNEQAGRTLVESQVDSGTCSQYMAFSVSLPLGLVIYSVCVVTMK